MHDFHAEDWYPFAQRGWFAIVRAGRQYPRDGVLAEIKAHGFTIDGRAYTLLGVDRKMPNRPIYAGEEIGLLVKEAPPGRK